LPGTRLSRFSALPPASIKSCDGRRNAVSAGGQQNIFAKIDPGSRGQDEQDYRMDSVQSAPLGQTISSSRAISSILSIVSSCPFEIDPGRRRQDEQDYRMDSEQDHLPHPSSPSEIGPYLDLELTFQISDLRSPTISSPPFTCPGIRLCRASFPFGASSSFRRRP